MRTISLFLLIFPSMLFGSVVVQGPLQISDPTTTNNSVPQIAVDPQGNAIAIWVVGFPVFPNQIQTARFSALTFTWSPPIILDQGTSPQVSVDDSGNAIAIWIAATNQINVSRFDVATLTWSFPIQISQPVTPNNSPEVNFSPQIAVDADGNAIAVWVNSLPSLVQVQAACFDVNTFVWSLQFPLSINTTFATDPQISMDNNRFDRQGIAVWVNARTGGIEASNIVIP